MDLVGSNEMKDPAVFCKHRNISVVVYLQTTLQDGHGDQKVFSIST